MKERMQICKILIKYINKPQNPLFSNKLLNSRLNRKLINCTITGLLKVQLNQKYFFNVYFVLLDLILTFILTFFLNLSFSFFMRYCKVVIIDRIFFWVLVE